MNETLAAAFEVLPFEKLLEKQEVVEEVIGIIKIQIKDVELKKKIWSSLVIYPSVFHFPQNLGSTHYIVYVCTFNNYFKHFECAYLKSERCYNEKCSTYYFYVKTKISTDFHICFISI